MTALTPPEIHPVAVFDGPAPGERSARGFTNDGRRVVVSMPGSGDKARLRAWLASLPPNMASIYGDLKRLDPKGQQRALDVAPEGA